MNEQQANAPSPPPSAEITYRGRYSVKPLAEASFRPMCAQIPAHLGEPDRMDAATIWPGVGVPRRLRAFRTATGWREWAEATRGCYGGSCTRQG